MVLVGTVEDVLGREVDSKQLTLFPIDICSGGNVPQRVRGCLRLGIIDRADMSLAKCLLFVVFTIANVR